MRVRNDPYPTHTISDIYYEPIWSIIYKYCGWHNEKTTISTTVLQYCAKVYGVFQKCVLWLHTSVDSQSSSSCSGQLQQERIVSILLAGAQWVFVFWCGHDMPFRLCASDCTVSPCCLKGDVCGTLTSRQAQGQETGSTENAESSLFSLCVYTDCWFPVFNVLCSSCSLADGTLRSSRWSSVTCWPRLKPSFQVDSSKETHSALPRQTPLIFGEGLLAKSKFE